MAKTAVKKYRGEWYNQLVEDVKKLEFTGVVATKHAIGKRVVADAVKFGQPQYGDKTMEGLAADVDIDRAEIYRCVQFAKKFPELSTAVNNLSWRHIRQKLLPAKGNVHFSSESADWFTPKAIIKRTVKLFGHIDLDPCSNSGEPNVPAKRHFTEADNGLAQEWHGRVYMNPPYGRVLPEWVGHLVGEFCKGHTTSAIALVPARPDTDWFRQMRDFPRCFIWGRLKFSGHENSAPFPSMAAYLGPKPNNFAGIFGDIGDIYAWVKP